VIGKCDLEESAPSLDAPVYCCQADGMVGLGCGARSYTSALHYSSEYAVGMTGVQEIVAKYVRRDDQSFRSIDYGYRLNLDDRQRHFLIQSLLQAEGLSFSDYRRMAANIVRLPSDRIRRRSWCRIRRNSIGWWLG
jgi:coproporphyrinogen III oxidase-like Fe-S oxidoreductase